VNVILYKIELTEDEIMGDPDWTNEEKEIQINKLRRRQELELHVKGKNFRGYRQYHSGHFEIWAKREENLEEFLASIRHRLIENIRGGSTEAEFNRFKEYLLLDEKFHEMYNT
jgi:hypothetical protein